MHQRGRSLEWMDIALEKRNARLLLLTSFSEESGSSSFSSVVMLRAPCLPMVLGHLDDGGVANNSTHLSLSLPPLRPLFQLLGKWGVAELLHALFTLDDPLRYRANGRIKSGIKL
jgi:hypothetical protein